MRSLAIVVLLLASCAAAPKPAEAPSVGIVDAQCARVVWADGDWRAICASTRARCMFDREQVVRHGAHVGVVGVSECVPMTISRAR